MLPAENVPRFEAIEHELIGTAWTKLRDCDGRWLYRTLDGAQEAALLRVGVK